MSGFGGLLSDFMLILATGQLFNGKMNVSIIFHPVFVRNDKTPSSMY